MASDKGFYVDRDSGALFRNGVEQNGHDIMKALVASDVEIEQLRAEVAELKDENHFVSDEWSKEQNECFGVAIASRAWIKFA